MGIVKQDQIARDTIAAGRTRYLAHSDHLMMVVIDFEDGPTDQPDPPHSHPHEQVSYVVSGEVLLQLGNTTTRLGPGDIFTVPPDVPHAVQLLTPHVRLVDTFTPLREDFLSS